MSIINAQPGYFTFTLKEIDNGQVVLAKHPVIAFEVVPYRASGRYETRPITAADHNGYDNHFEHDHKQTLLNLKVRMKTTRRRPIFIDHTLRSQ